MELATIVCVHTEVVPWYYTIAAVGGGAERQTEGTRLTRCASKAASGGGKGGGGAGRMKLAEIPPFQGGRGDAFGLSGSGARIGARARPSAVPPLPLASVGIGVAPPKRRTGLGIGAVLGAVYK